MKQEIETTPLGRPRAFDPGEALEQAMHLFWRNGYLGTSLSDLTDAMGINRPSLYAAFGNKESLFRQALQRYLDGPATYLQIALEEPTARGVVERILYGAVNLVTDPRTPRTCLWVHAALSCGNSSHPFYDEFAAQRAEGHAALRTRFKRALSEGDLAAGTDPDALARFVQTLSFGLSVQAATGASRRELVRVIATALEAL